MYATWKAVLSLASPFVLPQIKRVFSACWIIFRYDIVRFFSGGSDVNDSYGRRFPSLYS